MKKNNFKFIYSGNDCDIFSRSKDLTNKPPKSHDISGDQRSEKFITGKLRLLKQSKNRFQCVFRDCVVVNLDDFFTCHGCKPGRHFFQGCSEVNSKGYLKFD